MNIFVFFLCSILMACSTTTEYPPHWWEPVIDPQAPSWEILPQAAGPGEVILSKRNELGILSNFAPTPFYLNGKRYTSVEGFWQMMKYPDPELKNDPRFHLNFPFTREEVANMSAFEAKAAGDEASKILKEEKIDWVSFEGKKMTYCSETPGEHYHLIKEAMRKKLRYNTEVKRILQATGNLILKPDHHEGSCKAPEWKYYELWMEIREDLRRSRLAPNMLL